MYLWLDFLIFLSYACQSANPVPQGFWVAFPDQGIDDNGLTGIGLKGSKKHRRIHGERAPSEALSFLKRGKKDWTHFLSSCQHENHLLTIKVFQSLLWISKPHKCQIYTLKAVVIVLSARITT